MVLGLRGLGLRVPSKAFQGGPSNGFEMRHCEGFGIGGLNQLGILSYSYNEQRQRILLLLLLTHPSPRTKLSFLCWMKPRLTGDLNADMQEMSPAHAARVGCNSVSNRSPFHILRI